MSSTDLHAKSNTLLRSLPWPEIIITTVTVGVIFLAVFSVFSAQRGFNNAQKVAYLENVYPIEVLDESLDSPWKSLEAKHDPFAGDIQMKDGTRTTVEVRDWDSKTDSPTLVDIPTRAEYVNSLLEKKYKVTLAEESKNSSKWINTSLPIEGSRKVEVKDSNGKTHVLNLSIEFLTLEPTLETSSEFEAK